MFKIIIRSSQGNTISACGHQERMQLSSHNVTWEYCEVGFNQLQSDKHVDNSETTIVKKKKNEKKEFRMRFKMFYYISDLEERNLGKIKVFL